jgi:hypothetical protein
MRCSERSANRSGKCRDAFCTSRTTRNRRPPRRYWDRTQARDSWWQPTTRPPRTSTKGGVRVVGCQSSLKVTIHVGGADGGKSRNGQDRVSHDR